MFIRKARGKVPPYSWPVRADIAPEIYDPQDLAVVSRLLHRPLPGGIGAAGCRGNSRS
jgi:hypothetical protein